MGALRAAAFLLVLGVLLLCAATGCAQQGATAVLPRGVPVVRVRILQACRARKPSQKMVVLSNHATNDVRWRCQQLGADAVFDKSTEIDALVDYCVAQRSRVETQH